MKKSRFTESQIVSVLKEGEAGPKATEICRKHGISGATYYNWKARYGGASVSLIKQVRELATENAQYKRMYAEKSLECEALQDLVERKL